MRTRKQILRKIAVLEKKLYWSEQACKHVIAFARKNRRKVPTRMTSYYALECREFVLQINTMKWVLKNRNKQLDISTSLIIR